MLDVIEFGTDREHNRALLIRGEPISLFVRRPGAHPNTLFVVTNKTPNDVVWKDKNQDVTSLLRGGSEGLFAGELPFTVLNETHDGILYERFGLNANESSRFREVYNPWVLAQQDLAKKTAQSATR